MDKPENHEPNDKPEPEGFSQAEVLLRQLESEKSLDQAVDVPMMQAMSEQLADRLIDMFSLGRGIIKQADDDFRMTELVIDRDLNPDRFTGSLAGLTRVEVEQNYSLDRSQPESEPSFRIVLEAGGVLSMVYDFQSGHEIELQQVTRIGSPNPEAVSETMTLRYAAILADVVDMAESVAQETEGEKIDGSRDSFEPETAFESIN